MRLVSSNLIFKLLVFSSLLLLNAFALADEIKVNDSASNTSALDRGTYIVKSLAACGTCHGLDPANPNSPLAGGLILEDGFGKVIAPNITSDKESGIGNWTRLELQHAIRSSLGRNAEPLSIDSHQAYRWISDDDVNAVINYLKKTEPVKMQHERRSISSFSARKWGLFKQHTTVKGYVPEVPQKSKGYYGMYIVNHLANCGRCHSPSESSLEKPAFLSGSNGVQFLSTPYFDMKPHPVAPNIRNHSDGIADWNEKEIITYLSNYKSKELSKLSFCPTSYYSYMTEQDKISVGIYLRSLK